MTFVKLMMADRTALIHPERVLKHRALSTKWTVEPDNRGKAIFEGLKNHAAKILVDTYYSVYRTSSGLGIAVRSTA
jgi:hypothetical protein